MAKPKMSPAMIANMNRMKAGKPLVKKNGQSTQPKNTSKTKNSK